MGVHYEITLDKSLEEKKQVLKERVLQYCDDVLANKINTCKKTKQGVWRFLKDLTASERTDYPFYLDWNELLKIDQWARMFVHSKGVLANQPIELVDMQLWVCANVLGFKQKENGYRRYREAYIQMARKNAKTQLLAIIASYIAFTSQEMEEVYIAGWTKTQSDLAYNEILNQLRKSQFKKGREWSDSYKILTVLDNNSTIVALSKEARNTGDGTNPSVNIIDEYGTAHKTNEIVDIQQSGMVGRAQPLTLYITTPGFDLSVPCFEFYQMCSSILDPDSHIENDDIFVAIYETEEGDDIKDETTWIKANPIVAAYEEGLRSLRSALKVALDQPSKMRNFLTKNMGIWVDMQDDGYMSLRRWNKQTLPSEDVPDFIEGSHFYVGVDLSMTTDLTAVAVVFVKGGEYLALQTSFMPEERFDERMSRDKIRFDLYRDRGELRLTEGDVVDYDEVYDFIIHTIDKYSSMGGNFKEVCFDKWQATMMMKQLEMNGVTIVEIPQAISALSEPTKRFREEVYKGTLFHTDDHLFQWSMGNAVAIVDASENIKISKNKSKDRIDPVSATMNAFARAMGDELVYDLNAKVKSGEFSF